jgi:hypothetical protein
VNCNLGASHLPEVCWKGLEWRGGRGQEWAVPPRPGTKNGWGYYISLKAFIATNSDKIFFGCQPCQYGAEVQHSTHAVSVSIIGIGCPSHHPLLMEAEMVSRLLKLCSDWHDWLPQKILSVLTVVWNNFKNSLHFIFIISFMKIVRNLLFKHFLMMKETHFTYENYGLKLTTAERTLKIFMFWSFFPHDLQTAFFSNLICGLMSTVWHLLISHRQECNNYFHVQSTGHHHNKY